MFSTECSLDPLLRSQSCKSCIIMLEDSLVLPHPEVPPGFERPRRDERDSSLADPVPLAPLTGLVGMCKCESCENPTTYRAQMSGP